MDTKQKKKVYLSKTFYKIQVEDITHFQSDLNYTEVHLIDGSKHLFSYTLKRYDDYLKNNNSFVRIHRAVIVNKDHVVEKTGHSVVLRNGIELPLARRRSTVFN